MSAVFHITFLNSPSDPQCIVILVPKHLSVSSRFKPWNWCATRQSYCSRWTDGDVRHHSDANRKTILYSNLGFFWYPWSIQCNNLNYRKHNWTSVYRQDHPLHVYCISGAQESESEWHWNIQSHHCTRWWSTEERSLQTGRVWFVDASLLYCWIKNMQKMLNHLEKWHIQLHKMINGTESNRILTFKKWQNKPKVIVWWNARCQKNITLIQLNIKI